eukprot:gnl/TRDRNA2_/TRDRNA2_186997_c0_seq1.p1 gnl/TRDRNA2_/TRDRNA2_186997_c0~~gnl/TRDRNA2_/TRDRNA2_186997_c0_seq1.p1  ORF type:complete len:209 (-),score=18.32 gnl/TRDRNA2_/TRDRNA2_186997_c0_seq1:255-881(-)
MFLRSRPFSRLLLAFAVEWAVTSGLTLEKGLHRPAAHVDGLTQKACDDVALLQLKVRLGISPPEMFNPDVPASLPWLTLKELKHEVASKPVETQPEAQSTPLDLWHPPLTVPEGYLTKPTVAYLTATPATAAVAAVPRQGGNATDMRKQAKSEDDQKTIKTLRKLAYVGGILGAGASLTAGAVGLVSSLFWAGEVGGNVIESMITRFQ